LDLLEKFGGWFVALLVAVIAWFSRRDLSRYDKGLDRISELELNTVSHEQLERALDKFSAVREAMHAENREQLQRIEKGVNSVKIKVAVLAATSNIKLPEESDDER
jgi:hypothetical protein